MFARILLLLAPVASLGCGINNNCGPLNPFGCAKDSGANMFGEEGGTSAGETVEGSTSSGSTVTPTSGETSAPETSMDTTTTVDPTTSGESTSTSTADVSTSASDSTTNPSTSSESTNTADDTSTGDPPCGNGILEENRGEECDDGNGDAISCDENCQFVERRVFLTSIGYSGALGGLEGADGKCQELANGAMLQADFQAWLSTQDGSPSTRFGDDLFAGQYVRIDGIVVANGWEGLTSGDLQNPINVDEKKKLWENGLGVWTNTEINGTSLSDKDCMDWLVGLEPSVTGLSTAKDSTWTNNSDMQVCSGSKRLYCIEVP